MTIDDLVKEFDWFTEAQAATLRGYATALVAAERAACAQIAERWGADDAADEIRARGAK